MHASLLIRLALPAATLLGWPASAVQTNAARPSERRAEFDRDAAVSALSDAATEAQVCEKDEGPHGVFEIEVNYRNDGQIESANISPPMGLPSDVPSRRAITAEVQSCVDDVFRKAVVPPFGGPAMMVRRTFAIRYCDGTFPPASPEPPAPAKAAVAPRDCAVSQPSASQGTGKSVEPCILNLSSKNDAVEVVLDDKLLGVTPQSGIRVSAGWHKIRYKHHDRQMLTTMICQAGSTKTVRINMN